MAETIRPSKAREKDLGFFDGRPAGVNWTLRVVRPDGSVEEFVGVDWEAKSRFGSVANVVVCDRDGKPLFDRPEYREAANINAIAYGVRDGEAQIAVLHEARPHADDPRNPDSTEALVFGQIPMGFLEKILGKEVTLEEGWEAAAREVREETGAGAIMRITRPHFPWQNPTPTFVATWCNLFFVQVDLARVEALKLDRNELIYKAEYVTARELLRRIRVGEHEGAIYRAATSLSLLMIFFATHPEFFPR